jgi:hypothetical protein
MCSPTSALLMGGRSPATGEADRSAATRIGLTAIPSRRRAVGQPFTPRGEVRMGRMVTDPVTALICHGCAMTAEEGARHRGRTPSDLLFLSRDGGI